MIVIYSDAFYDAFDRITDTGIIRRADNAIQKLKSANSLREVSNVTAMQGYPGYYRLRFGDFRIGFFLKNENTIMLLTIEHRSKIYKNFP